MKEHSAEFNAQHFDRPEAWPDDGTNWSVAWGSPSNQWRRTIEPRIALLPCADGAVLDIGCGHGRWVPFLARHFADYIGIDSSQGCVDFCSANFAQQRFSRCDGKTIPLADSSVGFVYSFDSLVHADLESCRSYIRECYRVLRDGGSAFLHLSAFSNSGAKSNDGWRSEDGDWWAYVWEARCCGKSLDVRVERIAWMQREWLNDCFVSFTKTTGSGEVIQRDNLEFMDEAEHG